MAISADLPISAGFALREFGPRSEENPDGWGLGWYPDGSLSLVKEPIKWAESPMANFLQSRDDATAKLWLAHVRHKTIGGSPSHADTHPFARELGGRDYCLAHNGTLEGAAWELTLGRFLPVGETDSERFFCHLLHRIEQHGGHLDTPDDWSWLHKLLSAANRFGKLNILMSDGNRLFVYHDVNAWKGLNFLNLRPSFDQPGMFASVKTIRDDQDVPVSHGYLVATCPLNSSDWRSFQVGELIVFECGEIRYSSHRKS